MDNKNIQQDINIALSIFINATVKEMHYTKKDLVVHETTLNLHVYETHESACIEYREQ